ncbi:peroxisomal nicotinamide adenine dinucleotide carrier-like [Gossypium australe]|uniref:Peroxisomal nicotinamide adenine dinucleotide carrier-like n=1 Tax=Gossypium australe TaxID=47621 RepID=A0A5B6WL78_9ROSI|nr:peroxisomal nicotinamide adenine dinucleotide carrier-like [Gossypium australe]
MQTHTKISKKDHSNRLAATAPEETALPVIEPLSYGTSHVIQEVYDEAGLFGFWKGVFPTLIMVSNPSIQFMLYETMLKKLKKRRALNKQGNNGVTALEVDSDTNCPIILDISSWSFGQTRSYGCDISSSRCKGMISRLQAKQVTTGDKRHHYKGTLDAILKMIRYEGFAGFYKGMNTKIIQSVLAAAVLFMVKEELVKGVRLLLIKDGINTMKPKPL